MKTEIKLQKKKPANIAGKRTILPMNMMDNNGHSTKVRFCFGYITWAHIYAKFENDLLNTSAIICKT